MPRPDLDELEAENERLRNGARLGKACLPLGGCVGAYHADLRADLDAARAELAQRGELVGWVVLCMDAGEAFCATVGVYGNREFADEQRATYAAAHPTLTYSVAEVRALAGEGSESQRCNSADAAMTAAASGRGAPNTPGAVPEYPQTVYGLHSAAQVDITKESAQGLSEAERGRGMSGCPTGNPDHCDICWDAYIDERDAKEAE